MNSNGIINSCTCAIPDYTPQIIGIVGTLLGTFLGWLLKYLQDTLGETKLIIESFVDYKDESQHYAYNLKLFICNNALNPKYIRDFKVTFYKGDQDI